MLMRFFLFNTIMYKLQNCKQIVWASPDEVTSYDQHIEKFLTHLQNSIRLRKIWKSLGTLGWSPTTGSDSDTCSFSRGETGASVVEVLAVAGISSHYWMVQLNNVLYIIYKHAVKVICSIHSLLYKYQERSFNIVDQKLDISIERDIYTVHAV